MKLRPIFVEGLPRFDEIHEGELWISHKHRTINLRCPCGCGDLTVLSLHPSRWHVYFDGKTVSLKGSTGGSIWTTSDCGSHYLIRNNAVIWLERINSRFRSEYAEVERARMLGLPTKRQTVSSLFRRLWGKLTIRDG